MTDAARHFYCLSFQYSAGSTISTGSLYVGYPDQRITIPRLNQAKLDAGMSPNSVVMGISYMGHMTRAEITGEALE